MSLHEDFVKMLGPDRVLAGNLDRHLYSKDAGAYRGDASMVVIPATTADVVEVVRIAERHGAKVVARGAGTGLAGGAAPMEGAVVVSLTHLAEIEDIDLDNRTAWVGPGVVNLDLSRHTQPHGYHFAPDPSSQQAVHHRGQCCQQFRRSALPRRRHDRQPRPRRRDRVVGR